MTYPNAAVTPAAAAIPEPSPVELGATKIVVLLNMVPLEELVGWERRKWDFGSGAWAKEDSVAVEE